MKSLVDALKGGPKGVMDDQGGQFGEQPTAETEGGDMQQMLDEIEANVEKGLPAQLKKAYLAIVLAGRQLMFSPQTHPEMQQYLSTIRAPQDIPQKVAHGVVKVISIVANEVQKKGLQQTFSVPAAGAASITLMCAALKYVDGQLNLHLTTSLIDQTTQLVVKGILALFQVSQEQLKQAFQAVQNPNAKMGEGFTNEARTPEEASKEAEPAPTEDEEEDD